MKKALVSALFFACLLRTAVAADLLPPQQFEFYYGGVWFGVSVQLQDGEKLVFEQLLRGRERVLIKPSAEAWARFRRRLDQLDVWSWKEGYPNEAVLDGAQWGIRLRYKDRTLDVSGSNAYPLPGGASNNYPEPTAHFKAFLGSVQDLIGRELR